MSSTLVRIERQIAAFRSYRKRELKPRQFPLRVWVEPTARCNLRCGYCPNLILAKSEKGLMEFDLYKKIVDQLSGRALDINLFHRGESLMHPQLDRFIEYACQKGLYTRLHTNATLLTDEISERIIQAGLDWISFSFDGYDKEVYERNRVLGRYERVVGNIRQFLSIKRQLKLRRPFAVLQTMEIGYEHLPPEQVAEKRRRFRAQFAGLPLNRFVVRIPHNWAGSIKNFTVDQLRAAGYQYTVCTFPWYAMVILSDGRVSPCPQDFMAEMIMGDLRTQTIEEVWRGMELRRLREDLGHKCQPTTRACLECDRIWRKTIAGIPADYLSAYIGDGWAAIKSSLRRD